jgi:hypothetical protein
MQTKASEVRGMPEKRTVERARSDARQGKAPSTQAGEFVREEMDHIREGKHGARSPKQAIAIGLSKARRAGVKLAVPKRNRASERTRNQAARESRQARAGSGKISARRSHSALQTLKRELHGAASPAALAAHARRAARARSKSDRSRSAKRGARTRRR